VAFFDVYVERPRDDSAGGRSLLAHRIAQRFSLAPEAVMDLVSEGRFRVKARVAQDLAHRLGTELQDLGAVVSIVDADRQPAGGEGVSTPLDFDLDSVDATALVALDGSAAEKREMPAEAFRPPDAESLDEEDVVELAEPEILQPRPMAPSPVSAEGPAPAATIATPSASDEVPVAPPRRGGGSALLTQHADGRLAFLRGLRDRPVMHAAIGLLLAIVVGYIPSCLYTDHVRRHEIQPLRQEEVLLTHRPPEGAKRTAVQVREDIDSIKWRELFVCVTIWVMVGGAGAWSYFRLT